MKTLLLFSGLLLLNPGWQSPAEPAQPHFRRYFVAAESYESVAVFDVDKNGASDLVSGDFWYEGPLFRKRHLIGNQRRYDQYYDDFSTIPLDVNADGRTDIVTGAGGVANCGGSKTGPATRRPKANGPSTTLPR